MKNIFIVEDEVALAENVETILSLSGYSIVGKEGDGAKAFDLILRLKPDLILMDVMLQGKLSGIDVAQMVREVVEIPIIFITAHSDKAYLEKISLLNYDAYILKPFSKEVLISTIYLSFLKQNKRGQTTNVLNIRDKGFIVPLKEDQIMMLKADGLYTRIYTTEREYVVRDILKDVTSRLSDKKFLRIHKSYIVNLDFITAFNSKEVAVKKFIVPIRRGFFKQLSEILHDRVNEP
ncbi:MAG: response regulator transcription factor [Algoriphagus sp.]|uniref:LytR/AlgR family response regulator transcription factor n=1 Tax=Algoriphagus sp. TaxID=1872435 RepID=UPI002616F054|nr:response regulator transcription factor [Algoriphagus sp.]MDG1277485.1 response regulator transcription factor [Algoriphagus sp.]